MARIRTVKPEFWTSPDTAALSREARLLFIGTWTMADDHGYLVDDPGRLLLTLYPGDRDVDEGDVAGWLGELIERGLLARLNDAEDRALLQVVNFRRHQRIDRPSKSRFAVPEAGAPSGQARLPAPEPEPEAKPKRKPKAKVDQDALPEDFPERLKPFVEPVKAILLEVAEGNGARSPVVPTTRTVGMALADFEFRDFLPVARDYRAWQLGAKIKRPHRDPTKGFRNQLDMNPDVLRPETPGSKGPGESESERTARRLRELEA